MKSSRGFYLRVLLLLAALVGALALLGRGAGRGRSDAWLPSTLNPVGGGSLALFETLRQEGWPVERWRDPLSRLVADSGAGERTLVITRSAQGRRLAYSTAEIDLLWAWVERGNRLLLFGPLDRWDDTRALLRRFGYVLPEPPVQTAVTDFMQALTPDRDFTGVPGPGPSQPLRVYRQTAPLPAGWPRSTLLWGQPDAPLLLEIAIGRGRLVVGASDRFLENRALSEGENLARLLEVLAPAGQVPTRLIFEERHHGYGSIVDLQSFYRHPGVRLALLIALLAAIVFLASSWIRFGAIVPRRAETGRSTLEFIDSIADLHQRADLRNETIRDLFAETHRRLLDRFHLPPSTSHEALSSRLGQAHPELTRWSKLAHRFTDEGYVSGLPPTGWLRVTRELIAIKLAIG